MSNATKNRSDHFIKPNGEQVPFFKVPLSFQVHQSGLTQSEKDIYIFFMIQGYFKKSLEIQASNEEMRYWTGIKDHVAIRRAVRGLAEKGWIGDVVYQKRGANKYVVLLEPKRNQDLINKMDLRSERTSKAKKKSIKKGESGKFKPVENNE